MLTVLSTPSFALNDSDFGFLISSVSYQLLTRSKITRCQQNTHVFPCYLLDTAGSLLRSSTAPDVLGASRFMENSDTRPVRRVRCPRCLCVLEEPGAPVYQCGGCGTSLRGNFRFSSCFDRVHLDAWSVTLQISDGFYCVRSYSQKPHRRHSQRGFAFKE